MQLNGQKKIFFTRHIDNFCDPVCLYTKTQLEFQGLIVCRTLTKKIRFLSHKRGTSQAQS